MLILVFVLVLVYLQEAMVVNLHVKFLSFRVIQMALILLSLVQMADG